MLEPVTSSAVAALQQEVAQLQARLALLETGPASMTLERDRIWQVSGDMLGVADRDSIWRSVNPAWTATLGWAVADIVGQTSLWLLHPDDRQRTVEEHGRLRDGHTLQGFENRFRTKDGRYRLLSWTAVPLDGQRYCVARDVTDEREREKALRDSLDFTRLALSAVSGVGVWTYEVASDRFFCDAAIAALYGIDPVQAAAGILRSGFLANVHVDDLVALRATMSGGLVRSGDLELEYRIAHPDGSTRWVLSRGHTYFDDAGAPLRRTGVGIDMTQQRLMEQQLRQSQKMEAVGQLTGGLAHDFNNLLAGILGSLDLMTIRIGQGRIGELSRYINVAKGAATRAAALTHRLLAFSRRQTLNARPTDINALVAGMEELIRRTVGPAIAIQVQPGAALWTARVDANQLENALLNLCLNARDAMPDGGRIVIDTGNHVLDAPAAAALDIAPGPYLCLGVADSGSGMTAQVMAHAFDPFFTTKPTGQGTGLGLSMIYGFVRQSGGQVQIESAVGRGTRMRVYLPRHDGAAEVAPALAPGLPAAGATQGETVLVVDDEPMVRMLVTEVVRDLGYGAIEAGDGAQALAVLQSGARVDLLVTDVGLTGGINGRQVADGGRGARPGLKVLFITGYADHAVLGDGTLEPGMHVLTKPFAVAELGRLIRTLIGTESGPDRIA